MTNSIEVIKPFVQALSDESITNVQIIGGVNAIALCHPDTIIDTKNKEVIAPLSLNLPTRRPDGVLRDLDVLVHSCKDSDISRVKRLMARTVGSELDPSVFGFKSHEVLERQLSRPFGYSALKTFLSDRYIMSDGTSVKSLYPFSVPIDPESLETWTLIVGDMHAPIPNPAMSVINYTNRSIGGIRPKDVDKVELLSKNIFSKVPKLRDWAIEGPGWSQVQLGLLLRSLTPNKRHNDIFGVDREILPLSKVVETDAFMLPEVSLKMKRRIIGSVAIKAEILSRAESNKFVRFIFQKYFERRLDSIIENK